MYYQKKIISFVKDIKSQSYLMNLHYLQVFPSFLQKSKRYKISAKYFSLPLHTNSIRWDRCYGKKKNILLPYTKTMKKADGSLPIGFVNEDCTFERKKWKHLSFYILKKEMNHLPTLHEKFKKWGISSSARDVIKNCM